MLTERFGPMLLNQPNSFLSSVIKQEPIPQDGLVSEVLLFPELCTNLNFPLTDGEAWNFKIFSGHAGEPFDGSESLLLPKLRHLR